MGAIFSRVKNWNAENLTNEDLNAEIDNILTNFVPLQFDDYSTNVAQMQTTADPGEVGTESLATTLAGELDRLRFAIADVKGTTQWYETPATTINALNDAVGTGLVPNRLISGKEFASTDQALFLKANGAAATATVEGAVDNFIYAVEGVQYTIITDTDIAGLSVAPSANNTALIDDPSAADGLETKYLGSFGTEIHLDTVGSEISSKVGDLAAFKITNDAAADEYFLARIKDAATLAECTRGYFFDSSRAHIPAIVFANNKTVTLMNLAWIFAKIDLTLTVTYVEPTYAGASPAGPSIGDYWFDNVNNKWMTYSGVAFIDADATLVGIAVIDATNCVATRSFDYFKSYNSLNTVKLIKESATVVRSERLGATVSINGLQQRYDHDNITWDITTDLESGESETVSTYYYAYLTETGVSKLSTIAPFEAHGTRQGFYHPKNTWRCIGKIFNNGSGDIDPLLIVSTSCTNEQSLFSNNLDIVGSTYLRFSDDVQSGEIELTGTQTLSRYLYSELFTHLGTNVGEGDAADTFHIPDVDGRFIRGTDNGSGRDTGAGSRTAMNTNGNTGDAVGSIQAATSQSSHNHQWYNYTSTSANGETYNSGGSGIVPSVLAWVSAAHVSGSSSSGDRILAVDSYTTNAGAVNASYPVNLCLNVFMKVSR